MTTSGGGGFCDCGDTEAWKEGPYCQKHEPYTSETAEEEDPLVHLPEDMVARAYNIFAITFKYAVDILTWEKENELPGLEMTEKSDTYYCMLFNDEVHTYEQVIYTLQKAVNCTQKEAIGFATTVDRDRNTSRQTKPLKVQVMHSSIVAHQSFGLKLLTWLGSVIGYSDGLRRILCQVGLQEGPDGENSSLVDKLMLCDSKLWKGARNVYHQLFMSSLLMDLKYKKLFAIRFARNYRQLQRDYMEDDHERAVSVAALSVQLFTVPTLNYERLQSDFMKDDHDREFSIADLSIQIFTVPSLARMLITEENLMTTIIKTFMDHLRHRDIQGRFQFERYTALQAFKFRRVQSLILDLKYVLISKPTEWSDDLRRKFLEGFDAFLELLKCMQGMDPITRQVGQHIEMEPEWEAAFTLQMKLTLVISMMQDWCALDEKVLIEAYKKCLTVLMQCHSGFTDGEQPIVLSMCGHSVETIRYCVSQEKVSIHLPVSRLLAGLHVLLSKTEVAYKFPELLPLIYYYHNVKCRREMFDKDIVMLQTGVSMMDPNHFLMIMLSRFELYQIFSTPDYGKRFSSENTNKDVVQQNNTLIEEMLYLIIMIVGERFSPGIGQVNATDEIKREIIHQLSIRPMAHSELVKALPEDENRETGMESVIEEVACFNLVNILQSDVMLCIMGTILQWAVEHNGYAWSESMLQRTFNTIKKLRESSSSSPVAETEGNIMEESSRDKDKAERKRKAEIARLRREKIMAQMSEMQRHFINENKELFQQTLDELDTSTSGVHENSPVISDTKLTALGPEQTRVAEPRQVVMCILCQEEQEVKVDSRAMVLAAFIQRSTVLSKNRNKITPDPEKYDPLFMHPDLSCGTHTGSCGHIMHAHCWQRYFDAVQAKEQRRQQRLRVHTSYDVENGEFLCPLCECLSNTVIPLLPPPRVLFNRLDFSGQPNLTQWIKTVSQQIKALHLLRNEDSASHSGHSEKMDQLQLPEGFRPDFKLKNPYSESIKEMLTTFGTATYKVGLKVHPNEEDPRVPIMCWGSCAYTIQTIERILADEDKPLFGHLPCRQVSLVLSFPAIHCQDFSGVSLGTGDLHLFHLVTMAHIIQILLTSSTEENGMDQENTNSEEELAVLTLYKFLCQCTGSYARESNKLIDLPDDYSCLINQASNFSVRECQVLFLAGKTKGCFYPPPYLDDYGETDQGLRRGNPLHLCKERFKKIQKLWQQHSITEEIGHAQEANQTLVGIDWQHL
ncbi:hypothetical protein BTVI_11378 [Pitangus sulphuratus]|nr:hypothetical protein BTVI_11378 [Pitangus sulphuratus]